jgi:hypothetical protein
MLRKKPIEHQRAALAAVTIAAVVGDEKPMVELA